MMRFKKFTAAAVTMIMLFSCLSVSVPTVTAAERTLGNYIINNQVRVQTYSDTLVRVEMKGTDGQFHNEMTYLVANHAGDDKTQRTENYALWQKNENWPGAEVISAETVGSDFVIETTAYTVVVPSDATSLNGVSVKNPQGAVVYSFASSGVPNWNTFRNISTGGVPGPGKTPQAWAVADSPRVYPAKWGYDPMPVGADSKGDQNGWVTDNDVPDVYVFVPKGDGRQLLADFVALTGRTEMIPLKSLGLWHSKYWDISAQDAVDTINKYRAEGFPLDTFVTDVDWKSNHSNGYDWNTTTFLKPGGPATTPEQYFKLMDDMHVDANFNDHPEPQPRPTSGGHINDPDALTAVDLNYRNDNLKRILGQGLDSWWYDRNWSCTIRSPFDSHVNQATQQIPEHSFGLYLYTWITANHYEALKQKNGDDYARRPMIMGNVVGIDNGPFNYYPDIASHRWSIQWTGDTHAQPDDLYDEITSVGRLGAEAAFAYVSSDISGHMDVVTPGQYVRWTQYAALSPIIRYHCTANQSYWREPWLYGAQAEDVARDYIHMRYRLLPLFYSLSHENYTTGLPIERRLDFNYPQYTQSRTNSQYTLGDNILQAPLWNWSDGITSSVPASWFTYNGESGLFAEYFSNRTLSGTPVGTAIRSGISDDFGTGNPGNGITSSDNFSIRWTGKITPEADCYITATADDGILVKINGQKEIDEWHDADSVTYFGKTKLIAGESYDIVVEYFESSGNAKCILGYQAVDSEGTNSRSVFIPDGTWTDVWTGETHTGPMSITATHGFSTSPIFVREGTIVPLAKSEGIEYVEQQVPWDNVALDVYPSARYNDTETLYEDDLVTVGYKDGNYRETPLSLTFDKESSEAVLKIDPASGSFKGAISNRAWKVRVHHPKGWGDVLSISLDGRPVTNYITYPKNADGKVFNFDGASPDADVYEILIASGSVAAAHEVRVKFASVVMEDPGEITPTESTQKFASLELITDTIDLSTGAADWLRIGKQGSGMHYIRGNGSLINSSYPLTVKGHQLIPWAGDFSDINQVTDYNSGTGNGSAGNGGGGGGVSYSGPTVPGDQYDSYGGSWTKTAGQLAIQVAGIGSSVQIDVPVTTEWQLLKVYLGAWNSTNRIEIWDDSDAEPTKLQYNAGGTAQIRALNVYYKASAPGTLHIRETQTEGSGNISLAGYSIYEIGQSPASAAITLENAPSSSVTLSEPKNEDWIHFGLGSATTVNRKTDGGVFSNTTVQSLIPAISGVSDGLARSNDFGGAPSGGYFKWTGGAPTATGGTSDFAYSFRGMQTKVDVPAGIWKLSVYTSVWWGKGQFVFLDSDGKVIDSVEYVSVTHAAGQSDNYKINVIYNSPTPGTVTIKNMPGLWPNDNHFGNASIAAMTIEKAIDHADVEEQNPNVLKTLTAKVFATPDNSQEFYTYDGVSFQWASSNSAVGPWTDIPGASTQDFKPSRDQAGKYLRVSATYAGTTVYCILPRPVAPIWQPTIEGNMVIGTYYNDGKTDKSLQMFVAYYDADGRMIFVKTSGVQTIMGESSFDYYQLVNAVPNGAKAVAFIFDSSYIPEEPSVPLN